MKDQELVVPGEAGLPAWKFVGYVLLVLGSLLFGLDLVGSLFLPDPKFSLFTTGGLCLGLLLAVVHSLTVLYRGHELPVPPGPAEQALQAGILVFFALAALLAGSFGGFVVLSLCAVAGWQEQSYRRARLSGGSGPAPGKKRKPRRVSGNRWKR